MTAVTAETRSGGSEFTLPLSLRLALRELRGGISGFYIFVACIALGATALAAVGTLSAAIQYAIAHEGRVLLGGDVEASLVHRQATPEERAFLEARGTVSEVATLRSMARLMDGSGQALVQVKAVDGAYPLYGEPLFENGKTLADIRQPNAVAVERGLLEQLRIGVGDQFQLGNATVKIAAVLLKEPDRLSAGATLGPRVFTSLETLAKTGLAQPGSLIDWRYRVKQSGPLALDKDVIAKNLPLSGFQIRDHTDPSPGIRQSIDRLRDFLTLVGLTALLTGGIGVANSVSAFIERKRKVIAAYKALGAPGGLIVRSFLIQVMILAVLGIAIGLLLGTALPFLITSLYGAILPVKLEVGFYPAPLLLASSYGLLIALIFILWPLGRARRIRPANCCERRSAAHGVGHRAFSPPPPPPAPSCSSSWRFSCRRSHKSRPWRWAPSPARSCCLPRSAMAFGYSRGVLPRPRRPELALALANIAGPGGLTQTVTVSLGAGLTLLTAIALTDASIRRSCARNCRNARRATSSSASTRPSSRNSRR